MNTDISEDRLFHQPYLFIPCLLNFYVKFNLWFNEKKYKICKNRD